MGSSRLDPRLSRHVGELYPKLDDHLAAAEAAQALVESAGWPVLLTMLDAEIAKIDDELEGRLLDSRAAYARALGRRDGLRSIPKVLEALFEKAESRLEDQRRRHEGAGETAPEGVV